MGVADELVFAELVETNKDKLLNEIGVPITREHLHGYDRMSMYIASHESKIVFSEGGFVDPIVSEVIHYSRCLRQANELRNGKLWIEFKFYNSEGQSVAKGEWVRHWFKDYEKWIRANFRLSKCKNYFIGAEAYELYRNGVLRPMASPKEAIEF